MINSQDIKKGVAVRMDGGIWVCIDFQHRKPGKGNTIMIIKLKNVTDGRVLPTVAYLSVASTSVRSSRRFRSHVVHTSTSIRKVRTTSS